MSPLKKLIPDALLLAGAAALVYGAWLVYAPAGWIVAGALAIYAGLQLARVPHG